MSGVARMMKKVTHRRLDSENERGRELTKTMAPIIRKLKQSEYIHVNTGITKIQRNDTDFRNCYYFPPSLEIHFLYCVAKTMKPAMQISSEPTCRYIIRTISVLQCLEALRGFESVNMSLLVVMSNTCFRPEGILI